MNEDHGSDMGNLYETDFIAWTEQQAHVLLAAAQQSNLALDWENLAEEVRDLGRAHYHAVSSQIRRIVEHLLKLEFSPATAPRAGWLTTIAAARAEIDSRLAGDPGLRSRLAEMVRDEGPRGAKLAAGAMRAYGEDASGVTARLTGGTIYTPDQILGDWLPGGGAGA